ncbi:YdcH family protein [Pseudochelatococcus contaminans]|uniref:DUF465 domain-containing protein n=1 Tax=Pseudochelatococcus contaminans TaxID=1538103 RepID=A0A7W5Z1Y3_9HYPH|nr:DUF465 domain-containing protein [Pseudochelatococcus contaminans]MBB3808365.1 hypothetical protein [Pseudochelatococcus contaminans]
MSIEGHIVELKRRREALEKEIKTHLARPSVNSEEVAQLKRRKLHLKDEMERLAQNKSPRELN